MSDISIGDEKRPDPTLIIVGVMGSGKSTIGSLLAKYLGMELVEVDQIVTKDLSHSIADLVISRDPRLNETQMRAAVRALSEDMSSKRRIVVLPASTPLNNHVASAIIQARERGAVVIELVADTGEIVRREGLNAPRSIALGAPRAVMTTQIEHLRKCYGPLVDVSINTMGRSPDSITQQIVATL